MSENSLDEAWEDLPGWVAAVAAAAAVMAYALWLGWTDALKE